MNLQSVKQRYHNSSSVYCNKIQEDTTNRLEKKNLLTDDSSTKIDGSFFSVAMTTPLEAATISQK